MLTSKNLCILELDGSRLCAVSAQLTKDGAEIRRWLSCDRPETVSADDPDAIGAWAAQELDRAGIARGPAIISVSRGDVVLKHLALPKPKDGADADLGAMVRLQMARQLALPIEGTSIDYAPLPESADATTIPVIAGAMPANRVLWCRSFAKAAGLKLRRIGLRCFGVAALLGPLSQTRAGTIVGVAVGWGSTELVIVEDGQMAFARAVDLPRPTSRAELEVFAEKVAVEVKRAWIGYRASRPGPVPDLVGVLGEGDLVRRVGDRCAAELSSTCQVVAPPPNIVLPREMPESERTASAALLGLLAESSLERPVLDFANPRKPVDKAARRRQFALAAAFGLLVIGGSLFTFARNEINRIESRISLEESEYQSLAKDYNTFLVEHARLSHLQTWQDGRVDWLAHINLLCGQVPQGGVAYAEEIRGQAASRVAYTPTSKSSPYPAGEWALLPQASFDFKGRSPGRGVATDMRGRFLEGDLYGVEMLGPDVADRFALHLATTRLNPTAEDPKKPKSGGSKKPSGKNAGAKPTAAPAVDTPSAANPAANPKPEEPKPAEPKPAETKPPEPKSGELPETQGGVP